jgi:hypothetical protein
MEKNSENGLLVAATVPESTYMKSYWLAKNCTCTQLYSHKIVTTWWVQVGNGFYMTQNTLLYSILQVIKIIHSDRLFFLTFPGSLSIPTALLGCRLLCRRLFHWHSVIVDSLYLSSCVRLTGQCWAQQLNNSDSWSHRNIRDIHYFAASCQTWNWSNRHDHRILNFWHYVTFLQAYYQYLHPKQTTMVHLRPPSQSTRHCHTGVSVSPQSLVQGPQSAMSFHSGCWPVFMPCWIGQDVQ